MEWKSLGVVWNTDELKSHLFLVHFFDLFYSKKD